MNALLEYALTGGTLRLGKREAMLELLRKDSALRQLLGIGAEGLNTLTNEWVRASTQDGFLTLDFSQIAEHLYRGDPCVPLNELKRRYGASLGGMLYFKCIYAVGFQNFYLRADLDTEPIVLRP